MRGKRKAGPTTKDDAAATDWLADFLPYQIYRVSTLMNMRLQGRLRASGLTLSQWRVLSVLRSQGRLSLTQIVEHTLMEQPTISRVIAQLEDEGRVTRAASTEDSRISLISLSEAGIALFDDIAPAAIRHQHTALQDLDAKDLAVVRRVLAEIETNIRQDR